MSDLHCDDVERLRSALSWMGYATPEGLEACCARQDDLVRDLIRAVLDQKKTIMDGKFVDCACGDRYPAISYGAGFIDAAGHCPNCHASLPAAEDARDGASKWNAIRQHGHVSDEQLGRYVRGLIEQEAIDAALSAADAKGEKNG